MGMQQTVRFEGDAMPMWESVHEFLYGRDYPVQMRMINGELAFPEEAPPADWHELRVGSAQGMVTLRRQGSALELVTWGNADVSMREVWNALAWAYAHLGSGQIECDGQVRTADEHRQSAELPSSLQLS